MDHWLAKGKIRIRNYVEQPLLLENDYGSDGWVVSQETKWNFIGLVEIKILGRLLYGCFFVFVRKVRKCSVGGLCITIFTGVTCKGYYRIAYFRTLPITHYNIDPLQNGSTCQCGRQITEWTWFTTQKVSCVRGNTIKVFNPDTSL